MLLKNPDKIASHPEPCALPKFARAAPILSKAPTMPLCAIAKRIIEEGMWKCWIHFRYLRNAWMGRATGRMPPAPGGAPPAGAAPGTPPCGAANVCPINKPNNKIDLSALWLAIMDWPHKLQFHNSLAMALLAQIEWYSNVNRTDYKSVYICFHSHALMRQTLFGQSWHCSQLCLAYSIMILNSISSIWCDRCDKSLKKRITWTFNPFSMDNNNVLENSDEIFPRHCMVFRLEVSWWWWSSYTSAYMFLCVIWRISHSILGSLKCVNNIRSHRDSMREKEREKNTSKNNKFLCRRWLFVLQILIMWTLCGA